MLLLPVLLLLGIPSLHAQDTASSNITSLTPRQPFAQLTRAVKGCAGLTTRNQTTCTCLPEFDESGKPKQECICPDYPNSVLIFTKVFDEETSLYTETASCWCRGGGQYFDTATRYCQCPAGYTGTRSKKNELSCKLPPKQTTVTTTKTVSRSTTSSTTSSTSSNTGTPTGGTQKRAKRALHEALMAQKEDAQSGFFGDLETIMNCGDGEKACEINGGYKCTDVLSSLGTCGGCTGETIDCASLPGVDKVSCQQGRCIVHTCQRGYFLRHNHGVSTNLPTHCVAKPHHPTKW